MNWWRHEWCFHEKKKRKYYKTRAASNTMCLKENHFTSCNHSKKMKTHRSLKFCYHFGWFYFTRFILLHFCCVCMYMMLTVVAASKFVCRRKYFQEMYANIFTKSRYCSCLLDDCVRVYVFTMGSSVFFAPVLSLSLTRALIFCVYVCVEARAYAQANNNNNCNNRRWCVFCICLAWHNRVRVTIVCFRFQDFFSHLPDFLLVGLFIPAPHRSTHFEWNELCSEWKRKIESDREQSKIVFGLHWSYLRVDAWKR